MLCACMCVSVCMHVCGCVCVCASSNFSPVQIRGWGWGNPWSFPPAMNLPSILATEPPWIAVELAIAYHSSFPKVCCAPYTNLVGPHKCVCTQQLYRWELDYIHPPFQGHAKTFVSSTKTDTEGGIGGGGGGGRARTNIVHVCCNYALVNSLSLWATYLPPNEFGLKVDTQLTLRTKQEVHGGPMFFQFAYTS